MGMWDSLKAGAKEWWSGKAPIQPTQQGIPGYEDYMKQLSGFMGQGNPYMQASQVGQSGYKGDMDEYLRRLKGISQGAGGVAAEQYKAAAGQGMQQAASIAASGRGNPAMAARQAQQANSQITQGLAQGSAMAQMQEQQAALGQYGGALNMADQSQFGRDSMNAQLKQQGAMANQQAWLQMLQAKMGMSAEQAQNFLQYYQAMIAQQQGQGPTGFDKLLNIGATVAPMFGAGGAFGGAPK